MAKMWESSFVLQTFLYLDPFKDSRLSEVTLISIKSAPKISIRIHALYKQLGMLVSYVLQTAFLHSKISIACNMR